MLVWLISDDYSRLLDTTSRQSENSKNAKRREN